MVQDMNRKRAEEIGIEALAWLAQDPELLAHFLNTTGASPDDLRAQAGQPEFAGFVLDFLLMSDENVLGFAQSANIPPESIQQARYALSGGVDHWT